ncbi:SHOCT domain-containing protein [Streptomyces sp. NPDC093094]|uniref:SHOCT domain-containing protein n=1 Tax=Streptomyces sp. NPDC093094 TaxID=3366026 RepID=UPI0037FB2A72
MQTLAHWDGGPGPWILLLPVVWAVVVLTAVTLLRRTLWRGRPGPWRTSEDRRLSGGSPLAVLGRRFASGEIDEDEYWRRLSVLDEQFGRTKGGAA